MPVRKQHQRLKLTKEVLQAAEDAAARGLSDVQVAEVLGISRATLDRRKRDDEAFEAAIKKGKARGIQEVSNMLFETALQGSVPAMIFYLKARAGWTDKPKGPLEDLPQPQLKIYCPDVNGNMVETDLFDV